MTDLWSRWVSFTGREIDARPLVLVRILIPLCILGDLIDLAIRGAWQPVLMSFDNGGINASFAPQLLGDPNMDWLGPVLWLLGVVTMPFISAGVMTRPAIVVGLLATSQFGHFFTPGDRAVDRLLRTTLLLLLFSEVTSRKVPARIAAWPVDLLKWLLVLIYLAAGIVKIGSPGWLDPRLDPELYRIVADPLAGRLDPDSWRGFLAPFRLGSWATIVLEMTAPLILTRHCWKWAIFGAFMHVGIFVMMYLGMFSLGMLAFYPLLFSPWTERWLDRTGVRLGVHDADGDESGGAGARVQPGSGS